jgi:uncharacterized protein (TIGR02757 family)
MNNLKEFLDKKVDSYNQPFFITDDPVSIPHRFQKKQDIEISAFFAAVFAWGNRTTIINKAGTLMDLMDRAPYEFITRSGEKELNRLLEFKHRTFNTTDLLYFIEFLRFHYSKHHSLEAAFTPGLRQSDNTIENALSYFHTYFFSLEDAPARTRKHVSTPSNGSTCKRLNMFLRWMVRRDQRGVDFGIWQSISPSQLVCPIDLHVARVAKRFNLLERKQIDWTAALELTKFLKTLDPEDPVKYDFALFGMGVMEKF